MKPANPGEIGTSGGPIPATKAARVGSFQAANPGELGTSDPRRPQAFPSPTWRGVLWANRKHRLARTPTPK
jgi:hypothetical protein